MGEHVRISVYLGEGEEGRELKGVYEAVSGGNVSRFLRVLGEEMLWARLHESGADYNEIIRRLMDDGGGRMTTDGEQEIRNGLKRMFPEVYGDELDKIIDLVREVVG